MNGKWMDEKVNRQGGRWNIWVGWWMDGWLNGRTDSWNGEWMDRWDKLIDERVNG